MRLEDTMRSLKHCQQELSNRSMEVKSTYICWSWIFAVRLLPSDSCHVDRLRAWLLPYGQAACLTPSMWTGYVLVRYVDRLRVGLVCDELLRCRLESWSSRSGVKSSSWWPGLSRSHASTSPSPATEMTWSHNSEQLRSSSQNVRTSCRPS